MAATDLDEDFERSFLGLDLSTQQLKAVIVDEKLRVRHSAHVQFDTILPEFRTHNGVIRGPEKHVVTAPVLMWVKALDILLDQLRVEGADFGKLVALSGTGQQHGTVYWNRGARSSLQNLDPTHFLHSQLASCFSVSLSPVWMDASTSEQCRRLENAVGGAENLARITGSVAYERFSGAQISKIAENKPGAYENTERISLVSSFACSLFLGDYAPIDWSDGSGMNLLDISTKQWCPELLEACASDLASRLGTPVPCTTDLGTVHEYYVERFGFNPECRVAVFTGDNPSSLAGMCLKPGDLALSLGTSDTLFLPSPSRISLPQGHVLIDPVTPGYMVLLCFKNGSLTRERIRDQRTGGVWDMFNTFLESTPRGNFGNMGIFYDAQEILPFAPPGDYRYDKANNLIPKFSSLESEVRALVEGQFLAKRVYAERLGLRRCAASRVLATGGGASNKAMLQVLADIFNTPVYTLDGVDSANLGAAYRAKHCYDRLQAKQSRTLSNPSSHDPCNTTNATQPSSLEAKSPNSLRENNSDKEALLIYPTPVEIAPTHTQTDTQQSSLGRENPGVNSSDVDGQTDSIASYKDKIESSVNASITPHKNANLDERKVMDPNTILPKPVHTDHSEGISDSISVLGQQCSGIDEEEDGLPSFLQSTACAPPAKLLCRPYSDASKVYDPMVERFQKLIQQFEQNQENGIK